MLGLGDYLLNADVSLFSGWWYRRLLLFLLLGLPGFLGILLAALFGEFRLLLPLLLLLLLLPLEPVKLRLGNELGHKLRIIPIDKLRRCLFDLGCDAGQWRFLMGNGLVGFEHQSYVLVGLRLYVADTRDECEVVVDRPLEFYHRVAVVLDGEVYSLLFLDYAVPQEAPVLLVVRKVLKQYLLEEALALHFEASDFELI